ADGRARQAHGLHAQRSVRARRLQGDAAQLPSVGWPDAPGDPARRRARARLGIAAAGPLPASGLGIGYAGHRPPGDQMPPQMKDAKHRLPPRRAALLTALAFMLCLVPLGARADTVLVSKDDKTLYICASDDDEIETLDLETWKLGPPLPSGPDPETFALHPDGRHLYVANEDNSLVSIVDIAARRIVGEIPVGVEPEGMGISPDGKWIVNTSETTSMAHFIDNDTHKVVANVLVDSRPRRAVWTADGKEVWVSSEIGGTVSVIDPVSHKITHKIAFAVSGVPKEAIQAVGIALTKDRKLAFVALGPANRVAVV